MGLNSGYLSHKHKSFAGKVGIVLFFFRDKDSAHTGFERAM